MRVLLFHSQFCNGRVHYVNLLRLLLHYQAQEAVLCIVLFCSLVCLSFPCSISGNPVFPERLCAVLVLHTK